MIREFALEPELVATWTDRPTCRFFRNELGLGTGRIVSRYPKRWRTLVYAAFQALHEPRPLADHEAAANQLRQTRLTELVQRLAEVMVQRRDHLWDSEFPWFDNACAEHQRRPFDAILARSATGGPPCTITDDSCEASNPTWHAPRSACVRRTPEDLAASVAMLLRSCSVAVFVDPHFGPENPRYRATFLRYFAALYSDRASGVWPRVGILTASDAEDGYYARECLAQRATTAWMTSRSSRGLPT